MMKEKAYKKSWKGIIWRIRGKGPLAVFKIGWRAALRWVLKDLEETYNNDFENSQIVQHIKKELRC